MTTRRFRVVVDGRLYEVDVEEVGQAPPAPVRESPGAPPPVAVAVPAGVHEEGASGHGDGLRVEAPLPGVVLEVKVAVGERVSAGQVVAILEAMKMENEIVSPRSGTVVEVPVSPGSAVSLGDTIVLLEP